MKNHTLSLASGSKNARVPQGRWALTAGLVLAFLVPGGLWAAGGSSTCYKCDNYSGTWECKTDDMSGGTECEAENDSCTVEGDCNGKGHAPIPIDVPSELIQEIAAIDGGAAATLVRLREKRDLPETLHVAWLSAAITPQDVSSLLAGGGLGGKTPGLTSRFDIQMVTLDEGVAALVMRPSADSDAKDFQELAVFFERDPATGKHLAKTWFLQ